VLALEEELGWERRAATLQVARAVATGSGLSGPWSAALTLAFGPRRPAFSAQEAATAWRWCGLARCARGDWEHGINDLDAALALAPEDLMALRARARAHAELLQWDRVIADCTACLKAQPDGWELWYLRALAYRRTNKLDLALADLTKALAQGGGLAVRRERGGLAIALTKWDLAVVDHTEVVKRLPKDAASHQALGVALFNQGKRAEAVGPLRQAVALEPGNANYQHSLGFALNAQGKHDEAITALRKATELDPRNGWSHLALGQALLALGCYGEARQAALACQSLPTTEVLRLAVARTLRLAELGSRLPALLKGDERPADAAQRLDMAELCQLKRHYATAARLYSEAFADQPKLAEDVMAGHRYNAACFAAQAGCGKGDDTAKLDDPERAKLRKQALVWLWADLALWTKHLQGGKPQDRLMIAGQMRHWQQDSDLAGLRDPAGVANLPADEREACNTLWAEVAALLGKAQER